MKSTPTNPPPGALSGFLRTLLSALLCVAAMWLLLASSSATLLDNVWPVIVKGQGQPFVTTIIVVVPAQRGVPA